MLPSRCCCCCSRSLAHSVAHFPDTTFIVVSLHLRALWRGLQLGTRVGSRPPCCEIEGKAKQAYVRVDVRVCTNVWGTIPHPLRRSGSRLPSLFRPPRLTFGWASASGRVRSVTVPTTPIRLNPDRAQRSTPRQQRHKAPFSIPPSPSARQPGLELTVRPLPPRLVANTATYTSTPKR